MRSTSRTRSSACSARPRRWTATLATAILAAALPAAAHAQQLAVDQIEIFLTAGDPTRSSAVFNVSNEGNRPLQASLYMSDWDRDSTGNNRFFPIGTVPASCKGALQVFPTQVRLEPHTQQTVRVTLTGTQAAKASCWSVVFVELQDPVTLQQQGRAVQAVIRVGTKIYVEPINLTRSAEVSDMRASPHALSVEEQRSGVRPDSSRRDVTISFRNTGGVQIRPSGRLEIRRLDNSLAATVKVEEFPVLPGAVRLLQLPLPSLARGRYVALALLDYGGSEIAGGQVEFEIP